MRLLLVGSFITALAISGCSSSEQTTEPEPVAAQATASATTSTARDATTGRQAGAPIQVDMYVRHINEILAATDERMTETEAMALAESMCGFLDGGNSPYDAAQMLAEEGFPMKYAESVVPKAIAAACTEHLTG